MSDIYFKPALRDTRFKKGQSGNPNGRPKGSGTQRAPMADDLTFKTAEQKASLRDGDRTVEITAIEAVRKAQYKTALGGSPLAQKHIIDTFEKADADRAARLHESNEQWTEMRALLGRPFDEAKRLGKPEPQTFPHPDDIVIDPKRGVRFVGPIDAWEHEKLQDTLGLRDLLLVQDVYDHRQWDDADIDDSDRGPGTAGLFAHALNGWVPKRYQLSITDMLIKRMPYDRMTLRELRKTLFQSWKAQRHRVPRGTTFPSIGRGKELLTLLYQTVRAAGAG